MRRVIGVIVTYQPDAAGLAELLRVVRPQLAHLVILFQGMPEGELGVDLVAVPAADPRAVIPLPPGPRPRLPHGSPPSLRGVRPASAELHP